MKRYSGTTKNVGGLLGVSAQFSLSFPGEKWVAWIKSENIEHLWHYATDFLQSFTMCLEK